MDVEKDSICEGTAEDLTSFIPMPFRGCKLLLKVTRQTRLTPY